MKSGFTLIELSIVLVIIGLIAGGVLVGRDLISAAEIRAQIAQIDQLNQATNAFKLKYGYLPGDIPDAPAVSYGFSGRGIYPGQGDGNGIIIGNTAEGETGNYGWAMNGGETNLFWTDLSDAKLILYSFTQYNPYGPPGPDITGSDIALYLPLAKIGRNNYIYAWSGGWMGATWPDLNSDSFNYFGISAIDGIHEWAFINSRAGMTVQEAYSMDTKIDDGMPQSGAVTAMYVGNIYQNNTVVVDWAAALSNPAGGAGEPNGNAPTTSPTPYDPTNCYDNNDQTGSQLYSLKNADTMNCALSFRFQ
jgi:prepilin-type N-terminal cleavage/methylation domain-containing protein